MSFRSPLSFVTLGMGLLIGVGGALAPDPSHAQQHQNGAVHQWWNLPVPAWNLDTWVVVDVMSDSNFLAQNSFFENNPNGDDGTYMGLQQLSGVGSRLAIFSVWNATAATPGAGGSCQDFGGEGIGKQCTRPFAFVNDRAYNLRMWRLDHDGVGQWWGAWVIDTVSGVETHIGSIRAPNGTGDLAQTVSFNEYFGPAVACAAVPRSKGVFSRPILNSGGAVASFGGTNVLSCSSGAVTQTSPGSSTLRLGAAGCGLGAELSLVLLPLRWLRRRRRVGEASRTRAPAGVHCEPGRVVASPRVRTDGEPTRRS